MNRIVSLLENIKINSQRLPDVMKSRFLGCMLVGRFDLTHFCQVTKLLYSCTTTSLRESIR
jgi:hypothetical protein